MIGVNAVGKTTILDAIRYCLTTNRNFNALGNKKSGRTLQGSVHAKQRGENAYRRPGHTVAYIGAEFWDSVKRTPFVIAVRVESEGPMQELHPGDQTWYLSEDGCTLEQLPFIDPAPVPPARRRTSSPPWAVSPTPAAPAKPGTASAVRWAWARLQPAGQKVQRSVPDGHQHGRDPQLPGVFVPVHPAPAGAGSGTLCRATGWSWKTSTPCWPKPRPAPPRWNRSWIMAAKLPKSRRSPCEPGRGPAGPRRSRRRRTAVLAGAIWMQAAASWNLNARYAEAAKNAEAEARRAYLGGPRCGRCQRRGPGAGCPDRGAGPPKKTALDAAARQGTGWKRCGYHHRAC